MTDFQFKAEATGKISGEGDFRGKREEGKGGK